MPDVLDLLDAPCQCLIITPGFGETDRDARFEPACEMYPDAHSTRAPRSICRAERSSHPTPPGFRERPYGPKATIQKQSPKSATFPIFLIEVTSPSDTLREQQEKCRNWIAAGVCEAILLHPKTKTGYVFLPCGEVIEYPDATQIASAVLRGFVIDCAPIWEEL